jgi:hypothetical protein
LLHRHSLSQAQQINLQQMHRTEQQALPFAQILDPASTALIG